jgi:hypothetical protein
VGIPRGGHTTCAAGGYKTRVLDGDRCELWKEGIFSLSRGPRYIEQGAAFSPKVF